MTEPMAHIEYAEDGSNPLLPYIVRAAEGADFYEIPEQLIVAYEQAKAAVRAAEDAIGRYIADNNVPQQDGFVAAGWTCGERD